MLLLRLATAAVGVPLLIGAVWLGGAWFAALAAAAGAVGAWEYHYLARAFTRTPPLPVTLALTVGVVAVAALRPDDVALALAAAVAVVAAVSAQIGLRGALALRRLVGAAGPVYLGAPLALAVLLREGVDGAAWVLAALLTTFAADTAAYAVGRAVGRRPFAPRVSPGKTWEGAVGGLAGGAGAAVGLTLALGLPLSLPAAAAFGLAVAAAAAGGDLAESALKRAAGAKDAGALVPGHGGLLDRADSLLPALVVTYLVAWWVQ